MNKHQFRRWLVVQKYTLLRGYSWLNVALLGVVAAASLKAAFPGLIDSLWKFIALVILGFVGLYIVGYIDYRYRFLHEEQNYATETNPVLLAGLRGELKNENKRMA